VGGEIEPTGVLVEFEFSAFLGSHLLKAAGWNLAPAASQAL
jgi:hypothetical protein